MTRTPPGEAVRSNTPTIDPLFFRTEEKGRKEVRWPKCCQLLQHFDNILLRQVHALPRRYWQSYCVAASWKKIRVRRDRVRYMLAVSVFKGSALDTKNSEWTIRTNKTHLHMSKQQNTLHLFSPPRPLLSIPFSLLVSSIAFRRCQRIGRSPCAKTKSPFVQFARRG
jgi:hypothetical protein